MYPVSDRAEWTAVQGMKGDGIDLHGQLNKMLEKILPATITG